MKYFFNKYDIDTFEIKLFWKIIKFTKNKELCESILSMESRTTWLSKYFNDYKNYQYALVNLDIINPLYYIIHNSIIKLFDKNMFKTKSLNKIIEYIPEYLFGKHYNKDIFNELLYYIKNNNNIKSLNIIIYYFIDCALDDNTSFVLKLYDSLYDKLKDNRLIQKIMIDNIYLILDHYNKLIELNTNYENNKSKDSNNKEIFEESLYNLNMNYLCVRQLPFTNEYIFMDLQETKLFFSYGFKKCLYKEIIDVVPL